MIEIEYTKIAIPSRSYYCAQIYPWASAHPTSGAIDRLQQLSVARLEDLLDAALDFTSIIDLETWLSQN